MLLHLIKLQVQIPYTLYGMRDGQSIIIKDLMPKF